MSVASGDAGAAAAGAGAAGAAGTAGTAGTAGAAAAGTAAAGTAAAAARADVVAEVLAAAEERARALADGNAATLERVLHPDFAWTSYTGESFDRAAYIRANTGVNRWHGQALTDVTVTVVGDTAVLRCVVADDVTTTNGREVFRMPLTQVWVRSRTGWLCLAGHAGPRLAR